jgi:hypothetical protein
MTKRDPTYAIPFVLRRSLAGLAIHRTQISLEESQYERLMQEARQLGISLSELLRRMIDTRFEKAPPPEDPLSVIEGIGEGDGQPVGREHNKYLY